MLSRKRWSFLMSTIMIGSLLPTQGILAAPNQNVVFEENFDASSQEGVVELVSGDKAIMTDITTPGYLNVDWKVALQPELSASYDEKINKGAKLYYDILVPEDAQFTGEVKGQAAVKLGSDWKWTESSTIPVFTCDDFTDCGNGYKRVSVAIEFGKEIEAYTGLKAVFPTVAFSNSNYTGKIYIDNVKLLDGSGEEENLPLIYEANLSENSGDISKDPVGDPIEPVEIEGIKALKFDCAGDEIKDWQEIARPQLKADYTEPLYEGATMSFDVILPKDASYNGELKAQAITKLGDEWTWTQSAATPVIDQFEPFGTDYKKATVTIKFGKNIEAYQGLKAVIPGLASSNCDYDGPIYISNVKLYNGIKKEEEEPLPDVKPIQFTFDKDIAGWKDGGSWAYSGTITLTHTAEVGEGALAIALDYSQDAGSSWSEAKVQYDFEKPTDMHGYTRFSCDFIYNPNEMTQGSFKIKLFGGNSIDKYVDVPEGKDYGNGLKKATVEIDIPGTKDELDNFILGIVGVNTDYKGRIYLDNVTFEKANNNDKYVLSNKAVVAQTPINVSGNAIVANGITQSTLTSVKLVDDKACSSVAQLYAYLDAVGRTDSVLFGHQNDTHHKAGNKNLSNSDSKDITGSITAVVGLDTLSLMGNEFPGDLKGYPKEMSVEALVSGCAEMTKEASNEGAIITLSSHMPNFVIMAERAENQPDAEGKLDWRKANFYSNGNNTDGSWVTGGDVVNKIMPGGELNYLYNAYLDTIAAYAHEMGDTPIMYRPLHENTGSWFWWGAAYCDQESYKNLYKYTVEYLRDEKGVHNFLYVYSPGSDAESKAEFEKRYPGDAYVDMVGFDMYHTSPAEGDSFMKDLRDQLDIVDGFAKDHNKLVAVTETGVANGNGALLVAGNKRKDWHEEVLNAIADTNASYYMVWSNFGEDSSFYIPYVVEETTEGKRAHEMIDNFIDFYNDDRSVFAGEVGNYTNIKTNVEENKEITGYIVSPISGIAIKEGFEVKAKTKNVTSSDSVKFVAANKEGTIKESVQAVDNGDGTYTAQFTNEQVQNLGSTVGTISLVINEKTYNSINAQFNLKELVEAPEVADLFEGYYGDDGLLNNSWSPNKGAGCSIKPSLSSKRYSGRYGLKFAYTVNNNGYAGITKNMNKDWSEFNALQLWTVPDGKNQKVVIQVVSDGKTFEVYLNDYAQYRNSTKPMLVTIPFSAFVGRDNSSDVFNPAKIDSMGLYCNAIVPEGVDAASYKLASNIYYDEIKAVTSNVKEVTIKRLSSGSSSSSSGSSSSSSNSSSSSSSGGGSTSTASTDETADKIVSDAAARQEDAKVSVGKDGKLELKADTVSELAKVGKNLQIQLDKIDIIISPEFVSSNLSAGALKVTANHLDANTLENIKKQVSKDDAYKLVGDTKETITFDIQDDKILDTFKEPLKLKIDLSGVEVKDASKLTLVKYEKKEDGTYKIIKLGGVYDQTNNTFEAYVASPGTYGVVEAKDLTQLSFGIGDTEMKVNQQMIRCDAAAKIVNGSTMVPLRVISENLGYEVKWNGKQKTITISDGNKTITMKIGEKIPGQDVAPMLDGGRTLVPIRYISESLGANVQWIPSEKQVLIVK